MSFFILITILFSFLFICYLEKKQHWKFLQKIPIRIHINGTRGKSSVARLIAAGIRNSGYNVICKTTGSQPRVMFNETSEIPINRGCIPNIIEQAKIIEFATKQQADVLVIECMALKPELQSYSELELIKSTHGVITNCGPDHLDVMGPTERDVALALAATVPVNSRLYTNEKTHHAIISYAAKDRNTELINIIDKSTINAEDMSRFSYIEHKENVALALTLCIDLGIPRDIALEGMIRSQPDFGAMKLTQIHWRGSQLNLLNAFAANDPASSKLCWNQSVNYSQQQAQRIMLVNCRADRHERSTQLALMCASLTDIDKIVVIGNGRNSFIQPAKIAGINEQKLIVPKIQNPELIANSIAELTGNSALIVGIGNIKDIAADLISFFEENSFNNIAEHTALEVNYG